MINSVERAYELVGERGENMYSFCKANRLPYSTINEHRLNGTQLKVDTKSVTTASSGGLKIALKGLNTWAA